MVAYKQRLPLIISLILTTILIAVGYWYMRLGAPCEGITPYIPARDRAFLMKLFQDNWYWLVQEQSSFSAERFLDVKTPGKGENAQDTKILVYCINGKPIGFVAYHKETFYKGRLRFIAIDAPHRGRGYSDKLMNYALEDMKRMGLGQVTLLTRTDNHPAQKLYKKFNFQEGWKDEKYVRFEKVLEELPIDTNSKSHYKTIPATDGQNMAERAHQLH